MSEDDPRFRRGRQDHGELFQAAATLIRDTVHASEKHKHRISRGASISDTFSMLLDEVIMIGKSFQLE